MPPPRGPQRAESLGSQAAAAARAAAAFYRGWRSGASVSDPMAVERQRQTARYAIALNTYRSRAAALRTRLVAGSTVAIGGAAVAASTLNGMPDEAPLAVLGGSAAFIGAWQALHGRRGLQKLDPPPPPPALAAIPAPLPVGSPGAEAAARVTGLRVHLVGLLPTVEQLHEQAADEIRAADAATAPSLNALVERIRSMQQIIAQMPGTPAAQSARVSIDALTIRLTEGANAYQELLTAVIALSAAPAITGGPTATLHPAISDMRAYAAGLEAAARTWE
jgi:hypothetical protein